MSHVAPGGAPDLTECKLISCCAAAENRQRQNAADRLDRRRQR